MKLKTLSLVDQRNSGKSVDQYIKEELKCDYESFHVDTNDKTIIVKIK